MKPIEIDRHDQVINYYIGVTSDDQRLVHTISDDYNQTQMMTESFVYNQVSDDYPQLTSLELIQLVQNKYPYQIKHVTLQEAKSSAIQNYLPKTNLTEVI